MILGAGFRSCQALDALVNILIQGRASVGGDDDISWNGLDFAKRPQERNACRVGSPEIPGESGNGLLIFVDDNVDDIRKFCHFRRRHHIGVQGVSLQNARPGVGRGDERTAVVAQDCGLVADTGQNAFPSSGESGKEVGFDKALGDQQVCLHRHPVDDQRRPGGQDADLHVGIRVESIVDDNLLFFSDFSPQLCFQLRGSGGTVETRGNQQRHFDLRIPFPELCQHRGQDIPAGDRTCVIGNDDGAFLFSLCQTPKLWRINWVRHGVLHQFQTGFLAFQLIHPAGEYSIAGNITGKVAFAIRDQNFIHTALRTHAVDRCPHRPTAIGVMFCGNGLCWTDVGICPYVTYVRISSSP